jgi:hypothetical protein
MYEAPPWFLALGAILTGAATMAALYAWPWSRQRRRIIVAAAATALGFLIWRSVLIVANGVNLDVDHAWLLGLSFEDIGTGVFVFLLSALALGLWVDRTEPARRVVTSAGLASAAAMLVDRFIV